MEKPTVILIDMNKLFREGLGRLLSDVEFKVVGEFCGVEEMLAADPAAAELILIDPGPDAAAFTAIAPLRQRRPDAHIVILTTGLCARRLTASLEAGVNGYLIKDMSADALAQSLRLVRTGEKVFPTHLADLLLAGQVQPPQTEIASLRKGLSQRETQILRCLIGGDSNKVIANTLGITEATVKVHLKSLLRKINAVNRTQAAIWAMNNGIGQAGGSSAANSDDRADSVGITA